MSKNLSVIFLIIIIFSFSKKDIELIFSGKPFKGFMFKNYSRVHFFPKECMELDLYRKNIEKLSSTHKKALALILLRRAMIRKMPYSRFNILWKKVVQLRDEEFSYKAFRINGIKCVIQIK